MVRARRGNIDNVIINSYRIIDVTSCNKCKLLIYVHIFEVMDTVLKEEPLYKILDIL